MRFVDTTEYVTLNCGPADRGGCGLDFAVTRRFYNETKRAGITWYCPRGHPRVWADDSTEEQLEKAEARNIALQDQLEAAEAEAEHRRWQLVRDRQRWINGVCPCCQRSFSGLATHVRRQHPEYDPKDLNTGTKFKCSCFREFDTVRGLRIHQGRARRKDWTNPSKSDWSRHLTVVGS